MSAADKAKEIVQDLTGMWWPDADEGGLRDAAMAKALDQYADAVHKAVKHLEHELESVGATIVTGTALAVFTLGISEGAAAAATASILGLSATLGVTVSTEIATIAGTTLATAAIGGLESKTAGISAVHPLTHALFGFRETPAGNREPLMGEAAALAAALADDRYSKIEFTCWKGYDQSLSGVVRRTDETTQSITLRLADVPVPDREEAVAALVRTLDQDAAVCRGFVIDRAGVSASQDWDRILVGDGGPLTVWPDTVGILRDRVGSHPEPADSEPTAYGPLDVFHRA